MSGMLRTAYRRRFARGVAGLAALAATLLAMLYLTAPVHGAAAVSVAAKKAPPEGGAPTRAVGERRFVTAEGKS